MFDLITLLTLGVASLADASRRTPAPSPSPEPLDPSLPLVPLAHWMPASDPYGGFHPLEPLPAEWMPKPWDQVAIPTDPPSGTGFSWLFMDADDKRFEIETILSEATDWRGTAVETWEIEYFDPRESDGYDPDSDFPDDPYWIPLEIAYTAKSWPAFFPFPEVHPIAVRDDRFIDVVKNRRGKYNRFVATSPSGKWTYVHRILRKGKSLALHQYKAFEDEIVSGHVYFDGDIVIPIVFEGQRLWMSHTPQEVLSQSWIVNNVYGTVVLCGLGLGWSFVQIANNPSVRAIVLIELSQELVDWILPRLAPLVPPNLPIYVWVADAKEALPQLQADWAVLDIWPTYTEVEPEIRELAERCPGIRKLWAWGSDWEYEKVLRNRR